MDDAVSYELIADLEIGAQREFAKSSKHSGNGPALASPELLHFLAEKVVIPILCGYTRDGLYHLYKSIKTRAQAEAAKKELTKHKLSSASETSTEEVVSYVVAELALEGVSKDVSRKAALATIERIKNRASGTLGAVPD